MHKTPDPLEVVRDKVVPAAEELIASVAERVSPLAKEAVDQVSPVAQAAAERTVALVHAAAEKVAPLTQQTREAVAPYAQHAAEVVTPYAVRVGPLAHSAADRVGPLASQAAVAVAPYAALVKEQSLKTGHDLADRLEPAYEAALGALSGARGRVSEKVSDVIPAVGAAATTAAASASPLVSAAADRGKALVRSVRHDNPEPVVAAPPPKKKRGWLTTFALVAAAAGATYVVVRRLVGDKGSQWQAARPSTPYAPPASEQSAAAVSTVAEAGSDQGSGSAETVYGGAGDVAQAEQAAEGGVAEASTISYYGMGMEPGGGADSGLGTDEDAAAVAENVRRTDLAADADEGTPPVPTQNEQQPGSEGAERSPFSTPEGESGPDDEPTSPYGEDRVAMALETAEERVYEEPEDAVLAEQDQAAGVGPDAHPERYLDIPGVYVGVEPPEGYTIKGNERSMKYHLPDSNSYGRTIAEIWFLDEAAAQQAGFTRAHH